MAFHCEINNTRNQQKNRLYTSAPSQYNNIRSDSRIMRTLSIYFTRRLKYGKVNLQKIIIPQDFRVIDIFLHHIQGISCCDIKFYFSNQNPPYIYYIKKSIY